MCYLLVVRFEAQPIKMVNADLLVQNLRQETFLANRADLNDAETRMGLKNSGKEVRRVCMTVPHLICMMPALCSERFVCFPFLSGICVWSRDRLLSNPSSVSSHFPQLAADLMTRLDASAFSLSSFAAEFAVPALFAKASHALSADIFFL